jgi:predicted RNase H-like HicB family nuclease
MYRYEILIRWSDEDQVYIAEAPDLPGCMAHGESVSLAATNINDAIQLWLDTARKFGDPIPEPRTWQLVPV